MRKEIKYTIDHCNSSCVYFFHKYEDNENIWCGKLNKKIFDYDDSNIIQDYKKRKFPKECPFENVE